MWRKTSLKTWMTWTPGFRDRKGKGRLQTEQLMYLGGLVGLVILLVVTTLLAWAGASLGEALYLSALSVVIIGYSTAEWRLRRGK